jgi:hypothetical protein
MRERDGLPARLPPSPGAHYAIAVPPQLGEMARTCRLTETKIESTGWSSGIAASGARMVLGAAVNVGLEGDRVDAR